MHLEMPLSKDCELIQKVSSQRRRKSAQVCYIRVEPIFDGVSALSVELRKRDEKSHCNPWLLG